MKKPYNSPEFDMLRFSFQEVLTEMRASDPQGNANTGDAGDPGDPFAGG